MSMDLYQQFIYKSRYSRWIESEGRREDWNETVTRLISFLKKHTKSKELHKKLDDEVYQAIVNLEVMPSMRSLMTAGPALERDNTCAYNCSYLPVDDMKSFDEAMFILMCGTGVGFSVERQYVQRLPEVPDRLFESDTTVVVKDSKEGWAKAYRELISLLYSGQLPSWDTSKVRPAGATLKTFGGRASGPEPLVDLFKFTVEIFREAAGRKLTSIECHDLCCKIASCIVVGGVRRSALISLSNLTDDRLRRCKHGQWWVDNPQRGLANNSACYTEKPDFEAFLNEWKSLYESRSGERGVFSRVASQRQAEKNGRRDASFDFGTNPCSEIILRPYQFCNLSEVVVRAYDTKDTLLRKVRLATILGTLQATQTKFRYLSKKWQNNTEEEALLGVSLTGIMDHELLSAQNWDIAVDKGYLSRLLDKLRNECVETNKEFAKNLGINPSAAITCVKPSGTVSQLVDSASGIHPRYAHHYIRRVRSDRKDPLANFMVSHGYEAEDDFYGKENYVFSFPVEAPEHAVTVKDVSAVKQLRLWQVYQDHWCEHKPSITVYVDDHEWMEVGAWVYKNMNDLSGVSFLHRDNGTYRQAPYEEITKEQYEKLAATQNLNIDWTEFHEETDNTENMKTLACSAGACEI